MAPRLHEIRNGIRRQSTPAPLLATSRGQLPNLPAELLRGCVPKGETLLLQLPLQDWYTLNANSQQKTADLLARLGQLPAGPPSAAALTAHSEAILVLSSRAASSRQTLHEGGGKSLTVHIDTATSRAGIAPADAARLHVALRTDLAIAPTDGTPRTATAVSASAMRRRVVRAERQVCEFTERVDAEVRDALVTSVQGGTDTELRAMSAKLALAACEQAGGVAIDGLYGGETPDERFAAVRAVVKVTEETSRTTAVRVLTGGGGAPWEVVRAVAEGVDVVDADYPFAMAETGIATRLASGRSSVNVRDRRFETCKLPVVKGCSCFVCDGFTLAYVRHLFEVHEMMGVTLVAAHNLFDYLTWFTHMRQAISEGRFDTFVNDYLNSVRPSCAASSP